MIFRTVFQGKVGLVVGMVRRSRLMFAFLGSTTLDPLASSSQAPRSSSLQAFEPSSFQAIKPSSFQAFKLSLRAFHLVGLIGIAKTKTSWKGGMGCKQTALHTFCIHIAKERLQKLQRDSTPLDSPDLLPLYSPPNISSVYKPIYAHLQVLPHNLHHFMHLISAPSSMP